MRPEISSPFRGSYGLVCLQWGRYAFAVHNVGIQQKIWMPLGTTIMTLGVKKLRLSRPRRLKKPADSTRRLQRPLVERSEVEGTAQL